MKRGGKPGAERSRWRARRYVGTARGHGGEVDFDASVKVKLGLERVERVWE